MLVVDGRQWKEGQTAAGIADKARALYGDRYAEFLDSPERIPSNILAERLKRLTTLGVIRATPYSRHPPRLEYTLTKTVTLRAEAGVDSKSAEAEQAVTG